MEKRKRAVIGVILILKNVRKMFFIIKKTLRLNVEKHKGPLTKHRRRTGAVETAF